MTKLLVLYNRPTDPSAFAEHYRSTHIPLAKKIPGLRSFEVSDGPIRTPDGAAPYHFIAQLGFDSAEALQAGLESPEGTATAEDVPNFATCGATLLIYDTRDA